MRILKQVLNITDRATYMLLGTEVQVLSVKEQDGNLVMYYTSNATDDEIFNLQPHYPMSICVVGTGHYRDDLQGYKYIGTAMMSYGLVWHCFGKSELSEDL